MPAVGERGRRIKASTPKPKKRKTAVPRRKPAPKPPSPAGDRPQTHGRTKVARSKPPSPAGDRPQTHGKTGQAKPSSPAGDRPQTHGTSRRVAPVSPAGDRPQTHGKTGQAKPSSPAGDRPQTHRGGEKFMRSKTYARILREAYKAQPVATRRRIAAEALARRKENPLSAAIHRANEIRSAVDARDLRELGYLPRVARRTQPGMGISDARKPGRVISVQTDQAVQNALKQLRGDKPKGGSKGGTSIMPGWRGRSPIRVNKQGQAVIAPTAPLIGAGTSAAALAKATAESPGQVAGRTASSIPLVLKSLPSGVVNTFLHPTRTFDEYIDSASADFDEKVERIKKEGALEDIGNVAVAAGPASSTAARVLLTRAPARAARLLSGGTERTPKTRGVISYGVGRLRDARAAAKLERKAKKEKPLSALELEALARNRAAGRPVAVVPKFSAPRIRRHGVAKPRGRSVFGLRWERNKGALADLAKERFNLTPDELKALWPAMAAGIHTPEAARQHLPTMISKIEASRKANPKGWEKDMDVLEQLRELNTDPDRYFTKNLAETMKRIEKATDEISANDPRFRDLTKEKRRRVVQEWMLDLEQGVLPNAAPDPVDPAVLKAIQRNNRKAAKKAGQRKVVDTAKYDPTPARINDRQWYHGTGTKGLDARSLDGNMTMPDSLFGQGIYLTTDRGIAEGYRNARTPKHGKLKGYDDKGNPIYEKPPKGETYGARVKVKKVLDLEAPYNKGLGQVFHSILNKYARQLGEAMGKDDTFILDEMRKAIEDGDVKTSADLYTTFRNALAEMAADYGWSRGDVWEYMADLQGDLRAAGIDALTHVGGQLVKGSRPHQVLIVLDPANMHGHGKPNPIQNFSPNRPIARTDKSERRVVEVPDVPDMRFTEEGIEDYLARIDQEAAAAGLARPMYFKSEKQRGLQTDFSAAVVGGGRAQSLGGKYEGRNLDAGIFDTSYAAMLRGFELSTKAKHNYRLVERLNEANNLKSIIPEEQGVSLNEALNRLNRTEPRINKASVTLVNPGLFKKRMPDDLPEDFDVPDDADFADAGLEKALAASTRRLDEITDADAELLRTPGWYAWPTEAARELQRELTSSTAGGRMWDIAKGATSKLILMTGNTPWLGIQFAQEFATTALATKGRAITPQNIAGTVKWWRSMNNDQRSQVAAALGLGATAADFNNIRLGSSVQKGFAHTWRAFKSKDFWHRPRVAGQPISRILNPVSWMRAADAGKTNVTRLLAAHAELSKMRPEAQDHLADAMVNMAKHKKAVDRLVPVFDKPTDQQLKFLADNPDVLESVADTLNEALGDWTTLTASERMYANRAVMFYPFVRYSARLMFWTLPVHHPYITAMLGELGALTVAEYRETFGNDDLPWNLGKVYWGKDGYAKSIDLNRTNPLMNSVVQTVAAQNPGQAVGVFPPFVQIALDQAFAKSSFADRDWRVNDPDVPYNPKGKDFDAITRLRIALQSTLSMSYPYRTAMEILHPGTQGDDSLLFDPRPMKYKKSTEIKGGGLANEIRREQARNAEANQELEERSWSVPRVVFGPLAPKPSRDVESSKSRRRVLEMKEEQERRRKKPGRHTEKRPGNKGLRRSNAGGRLRKSG